MSDNWLQYTPTDPCHRPARSAADAAKALLQRFFPDFEEVTVEYFDSIQFIDPGGNWSGVLCSVCGADAEPWWADAVSTADDGGFASLLVTTPCCHKSVSLNDLNYVWPAGFGSFVLQVMNPNDVGLNPIQRQELERILGCPVREIAQHL